jgi:Uma2 family endonuclease
MVQKAIQPAVSLLGPQHNGIRLTYSEFRRADVIEGYRYELNRGILHVSPAPNKSAKSIVIRLAEVLREYQRRMGKDASFEEIVWEPRIMISSDEYTATNPEPDLAAYRHFGSRHDDSWEGVFPVLVVEVVTPESVRKDYVRNRELYESVAEILEYWVIDPTRRSVLPTMSVFRRSAAAEPFERIDVPTGGSYEPVRWPGLRVDLSEIAGE